MITSNRETASHENIRRDRAIATRDSTITSEGDASRPVLQFLPDLPIAPPRTAMETGVNG